MNNNLPVKSSIFSKIINIFRKIFSKNKSFEDDIVVKNENVTHNDNSAFLNDLKNKVIEKEGILDNMSKDNLINEIEKNPELLESMDLEKLKDIDRYYDEIIDNYKKKLNIA